MVYSINKQSLLEAVDMTSPTNRGKFIRRGVLATNGVNNKQYALSLAPVIGAVAGGAIGNQIHGDAGTLGGVTYDDQLHNDDEFDGTGALFGAAAGGLANKLLNGPKSNKVIDRLHARAGYEPNELEKSLIRNGAAGVKTLNTAAKGFKIGANIRNKIRYNLG